MTNNLKIAVLSLVLGGCSPKAQPPAITPDEVIRLVDAQTYQFTMEFVRPLGGRQRLITGNYTLQVKKDQIEADLPYIGRAFQAPIGTSEGGMRFTSKDFNYTANKGSRDQREVNIKPNDNNDIQDLFLTIFPNGTADLRINSRNRQTISYSGHIDPLPAAK